MPYHVAMVAVTDTLGLLLERGGIVMIPLLLLSVVALALIIERSWFWIVQHRPAQRRQIVRLADALRRGDLDEAKKLMCRGRTIYHRVVRHLVEHAPKLPGQGKLNLADESIAVEAIEVERPSFERFMISLSTIITAAPLLGILGTVFGIIQSFYLLSDEQTLTDPRAVSTGIAEALLTTAFGLVIALMTLFPYMIFRGQVDRALGRLESLLASARRGFQSRSISASGESAPGTPAADEDAVPTDTSMTSRK